MAKKQLRTVRANGTALGFVKATTPDKSEYSFSLFTRQAEIDPVAWLAARANVSTSTARLHIELFKIGGVA